MSLNLVVKTIGGKAYNLQLDENDTILKIKDMMKENGFPDTNKTKLIFIGKILENKKTIKSYDIKDKSTLVIMKSMNNNNNDNNVSNDTNNTTSTTDTVSPQASTTTTTIPIVPQSTPPTPPVLVQPLIDGPETSESLAPNNTAPLIIPIGSFPLGGNMASLLGNQGGSVNGSQVPGLAQMNPVVLAIMLARSQQFRQLIDSMQLPPLPESDNFMPMLLNSLGGMGGIAGLNALGSMNADGLNDFDGDDDDDGHIQIELTESEIADITELMTMGFSKDNATQAYLVCNKDKELAASYLFDNNN